MRPTACFSVFRGKRFHHFQDDTEGKNEGKQQVYRDISLFPLLFRDQHPPKGEGLKSRPSLPSDADATHCLVLC